MDAHAKEIADIKAEMGLKMVRLQISKNEAIADAHVSARSQDSGAMSDNEKFAKKVRSYTSIDKLSNKVAMTPNRP